MLRMFVVKSLGVNILIPNIRAWELSPGEFPRVKFKLGF